MKTPCQFCSYPFDQGRLGKYGCPNCEATTEEKNMVTLTLRKHPDDSEMVELIERVPVKLRGLPDRIRTNVWALVHVDFIHDDQDLRAKLERDGEVDIVLTMHIYSGK